MATLNEIQEFISRYQETVNAVASLERLQAKIQGNVSKVSARIVLHLDDTKIFDYELPTNQALTYLTSRHNSLQSKAQAMETILDRIATDQT